VRAVSSIGVASAVFLVVFGGALLGFYLRTVLPEEHLSEDSKRVVQLATGLIATLAALVLGLLIASAKGSYDKQNEEVQQTCAAVVQLDRALAHYGPETKEIRAALRNTLERRLALTWPEHGAGVGLAGMDTISPEVIEDGIRALAPQNDAQRGFQARAMELTSSILAARWLVIEQAGSSIRFPLLAVVVFWLAAIFTSFGLMVRPNATVVTVLVLCALSASISIFLIFEFDRPFAGVLKISSDPLRFALVRLGQ
jgi:hypothetical protein